MTTTTTTRSSGDYRSNYMRRLHAFETHLKHGLHLQKANDMSVPPWHERYTTALAHTTVKPCPISIGNEQRIAIHTDVYEQGAKKPRMRVVFYAMSNELEVFAPWVLQAIVFLYRGKSWDSVKTIRPTTDSLPMTFIDDPCEAHTNQHSATLARHALDI